MTNKHTELPWAVFKEPETGNWFVVNSPSGLVCDMDGNGHTEDVNARHIVHCVNNHHRLREALDSLVDEPDDVNCRAYARALLAELDNLENGS